MKKWIFATFTKIASVNATTRAEAMGKAQNKFPGQQILELREAKR